MIVQFLMDWFAGFLGTLLDLVPLVPQAFGAAVGFVLGGAQALAPSVAALAPLLPFDALGDILGLVPAALTFWAALFALRLVLWALGR